MEIQSSELSHSSHSWYKCWCSSNKPSRTSCFCTQERSTHDGRWKHNDASKWGVRTKDSINTIAMESNREKGIVAPLWKYFSIWTRRKFYTIFHSNVLARAWAARSERLPHPVFLSARASILALSTAGNVKKIAVEKPWGYHKPCINPHIDSYCCLYGKNCCG